MGHDCLCLTSPYLAVFCKIIPLFLVSEYPHLWQWLSPGVTSLAWSGTKHDSQHLSKYIVMFNKYMISI
jgi:hypothetical protein